MKRFLIKRGIFVHQKGLDYLWGVMKSWDQECFRVLIQPPQYGKKFTPATLWQAVSKISDKRSSVTQ